VWEKQSPEEILDGCLRCYHHNVVYVTP